MHHNVYPPYNPLIRSDAVVVAHVRDKERIETSRSFEENALKKKCKALESERISQEKELDWKIRQITRNLESLPTKKSTVVKLPQLAIKDQRRKLKDLDGQCKTFCSRLATFSSTNAGKLRRLSKSLNSLDSIDNKWAGVATSNWMKPRPPSSRLPSNFITEVDNAHDTAGSRQQNGRRKYNRLRRSSSMTNITELSTVEKGHALLRSNNRRMSRSLQNIPTVTVTSSETDVSIKDAVLTPTTFFPPIHRKHRQKSLSHGNLLQLI